MHNFIHLNSTALTQNLDALEKIVHPSTLVPVLKSNAYGHGLKEIYSCLKNKHKKWLCVNDIAEAAQLRKLGFENRILVCGPVIHSDVKPATKLDLDVFVGSHETLAAIVRCKNSALRVHLEFDTGMSRLGFAPENFEELLPSIENLNIVGACMHFANVEDVTNQTYALDQLSRFELIRKPLKRKFPKILFHCAASAPALILAKSRFDLCRVGIASYGLWPSSLTKLSFFQTTKHKLELQPVLSWKTCVTQLNFVRAGQFIGYGCTYKAPQAMTIGVLPVGYFEGFPRAAGTASAHVLIQGQRCAVIGRICMNMMMIDVSALKNLAVGDEVTLIGQDKTENISVEDIANWCDSINYEVVSRLSPVIYRMIKK